MEFSSTLLQGPQPPYAQTGWSKPEQTRKKIACIKWTRVWGARQRRSNQTLLVSGSNFWGNQAAIERQRGCIEAVLCGKVSHGCVAKLGRLETLQSLSLPLWTCSASHHVHRQPEMGLIKQILAWLLLTSVGKQGYLPNYAEDMGASMCYLCTITSWCTLLTTVIPSSKAGHKKGTPQERKYLIRF